MSMHLETLLSNEFRVSSLTEVAFSPGVLFSSPVARGTKTSVMPVLRLVVRPRCYYLGNNVFHTQYDLIGMSQCNSVRKPGFFIRQATGWRPETG
jgi:hypothetical protein